MFKFPILTLIKSCLVIGFVCCPFSEAAVTRLSYGEACSRFQRCNSRAFINCANGHFCDCIKPSTMVFDESINKCATLVGENCSFNASNRGLTLRTDPPCVTNAECKNKTCQCLPGYFPLSNRTCGGNEEDLDNCQNNTCKNDTVPAASTPIVESNITTVPTCLLDEGCGDPIRTNDTLHSPNEVVSINCDVYPGQPCQIATLDAITSGACVTKLLCRNGTWECPYKDHQEYLATGGHCLSLIGGPCNTTENCIADAECVENGGVKVCHCMKGLNSVDRRCELAYGERCNQGNDTQRCDRLGPLECNLGKCACSDFQIYDEEGLKCRGLVGAKCNTKDSNFCALGAYCKVFRGFISDFGICTCLDSYIFQSDRICKSEV